MCPNCGGVSCNYYDRYIDLYFCNTPCHANWMIFNKVEPEKDEL